MSADSTINRQSCDISLTRDRAAHIASMRRYSLEALEKARGEGERIMWARCQDCARSFECRVKHPRRRCYDCKGIAHYVGMIARAEVARAIALGRLLPATSFRCADCPAWADEWDHRDYSRPLAVDPVCRSCNCQRGPGVIGFKQSEARAV